MAQDNSARPSSRGIQPSSRERAIGLVFATAAKQCDCHGAVGKVAQQNGIGPESVLQVEIDGTPRAT
jgi:hypothetical protein